MKIISLFLLCCTILSAEAFATENISCSEKAKTQLELNACGNADFEEADTELNQVYTQILSKYDKDPKFIEKLKMAQRAWLKFRDAEMEAIFPHQDEGNYYGSVFPMCYSLRLAYLINQRTEQLRQWIDRNPEGDICRGSQ